MSGVPFGFTPGGTGGGEDPLAALMKMLGLDGGGTGGGMGFLGDLQQMMSGGGGPVNWQLAGRIAGGIAGTDDADVTPAEQAAVADALRLADHWLDPVTTLPAAGGGTVAWSRTAWVEQTLPVWRTLCDPVAERVVAAMGEAMGNAMGGALGEGQAAMFGGANPLAAIMGQVGGMVFGAQIGQALGSLAGEVVGATDIGLPLGPAGVSALVPHGVAAVGEGLEVPADEVRLYLALREAAAQRLFVHVPWLRAHLVGLVDAYARGITVDGDAITEAMSRIDPMSLDPAALQETLVGGLFQPQDTPAQKAALGRLETALALVEGWVDSVVSAASTPLPHAEALRETVRRRRAAGGPAEQTFATLVGLELRPRRLRDAATLWAELLAARGAAGRDAVWEHPDLMPGTDALDDPVGWARSGGEDTDMAAFEEALRMLDSDETPPAPEDPQA